VAPTRFRVPDVAVYLAEPAEQVCRKQTSKITLRWGIQGHEKMLRHRLPYGRGSVTLSRHETFFPSRER
jgi:hypothetical protein